MIEIDYKMSREAYQKLLSLDGIGNKERAIDYINRTYGLLGTVVNIIFEG